MVEVNPKNVAIGKRIKSIRVSQGLDLAAFAKKITPPASASIASRWERGVTKPNSERLKAIAEMGNVSVDYLLNGPQPSAADTLKALHSAANGQTTGDDQQAAETDSYRSILQQAEHADAIGDIQAAVETDKLTGLNTAALGTIRTTVKLMKDLQESGSTELIGYLQALIVLLSYNANPAISGNEATHKETIAELKDQFNFIIDSLEK